jgi:hypothetical protein
MCDKTSDAPTLISDPEEAHGKGMMSSHSPLPSSNAGAKSQASASLSHAAAPHGSYRGVPVGAAATELENPSGLNKAQLEKMNRRIAEEQDQVAFCLITERQIMVYIYE